MLQESTKNPFAFQAEDEAGNISVEVVIGETLIIDFVTPQNNSPLPSNIVGTVEVTVTRGADSANAHQDIMGTVYINGVAAQKPTPLSPYIANNVILNQGRTITATYNDPYLGYGEKTITVVVDDVPPPLCVNIQSNSN